MGVSGINSICTYKYHTKSGKLSTEDGSQNNFTSYYNNNCSEEILHTLNGFDAKRKHDIETLMDVFAPNSQLIQNLIENKDAFELTCECIDAATSVYSVNGTKVLTVEKDHISVEGYENETHNMKLNRLILGLDALIHFADQQCSAANLKLHQDSVPMLLGLLREMGVDTSREFTINGTKCEVVNGEIKEAGNTHVIPSSVYQKALKRYEEILFTAL